jgi:transglutaminase-like putative cysteine protease
VVERVTAGVRRIPGDGVVKLPFGTEFDEEDEPPAPPVGVDTSAVDWATVRRSSYLIHQRISYRYEGPVHHLRQRLVVLPREHHGDQCRLSHRLRILNATPRRVSSNADGFGNNIVDVSIPVVPEEVTFISWSVVERQACRGPHLTASSWMRDPRLLESTPRTCADAALREFAADIAAGTFDSADLAYRICARVHGEMIYAHDVTGVRTTAAEAFAQRSGVCQDFAHVMLAVARHLGLPSRYVSGQMIGIGGSHAWVEVLVPHHSGHAEVLSLDPTHNRATGLTYLTIAVGRDYGDVAPLSGSYRAGPAGLLTTSKRVSVTSIDADLPDAQSA